MLYPGTQFWSYRHKMRNGYTMSRVLVIGDDAPLSQLLQTALTEAGHTVVTAGDGKEGVAHYQRSAFDVVVTDIVMPEMDGNEVADYIRSAHGATPTVIGMSGTPELVSRSKFDIVFEKPFAIKTFLNSVDSRSHDAGPKVRTRRA